jgi:tetratricopeptide (TPR) repeat protein
MTKLKASIICSTALLFALSISTTGSASASSAFQKHYDIGKSFLVNQNFELALKEFNAALALEPKNAETLVDRGTAYNGLRRYDLAIKDFSEAIKLAPNNYLAYNNRGVTHFRRDELDQSIKDLDRAIEIDGNQPIAYLNRAGASLANGTGAVAAEKIDKWLRKTNWRSEYSGHAAVLAALGYRQGNNPAAANALLEEALKKTDHLKWPYPALKFLTGKLLGKKLLEDAESSDYDSTQAHCFLALKFLIEKDRKQAQIHLDWVVKTGTQNSVEYWIARSLSKAKSKPTEPTATGTPSPASVEKTNATSKVPAQSAAAKPATAKPSKVK